MLAAAALAAVAFGGGYLLGDRETEAVAVIEMTGVGDGRGAAASIELLPEDESGNWPMRVLAARARAERRTGATTTSSG